MENNLHISTCGLGVNSIAGLIKATKQGIIFDAICFSDTGKERKKTYAYLAIINKWLLENGQPTITYLRQVNMHGEFVGLYNDCYDRQSYPAILMGDKTCSLKYKKQPFDKWANNWEPAKNCWIHGGKIIKYMWYDADEDHRTQKDYSDDKYQLRYLLVEQDLGRFDCVKIILDEGLPLPPKSSCSMCPSLKPHEIIELYEEEREEFYDAVQMERNAQPNMRNIKGLGRDFSWWDLIVAYRYIKLLKRNGISLDHHIPERVAKLMMKVKRSVKKYEANPHRKRSKAKKIKNKNAPQEAKQLVCELFKQNIEKPCECMD